MISHYLELFLLGIAFSFGPCMFFCGPMILSFVACTKGTPKSAVYGVAVFLITRLLVYVALAAIVAAGGKTFLDKFSAFEKPIFSAGGFLVSMIGLLVMVGKYPELGFCKILNKKIVESPIAGPVILGFIAGAMPCLPLLGVLIYIALSAESIVGGALLGFSFGLGGLISPVIILAGFAGAISGWARKSPKFFELFQAVCGFVLFLVGLRLIFH